MARAWTINDRMLHDMILRRRWLVNVENDAARRVAIILRQLETELAGKIVTYLGDVDPSTWLTAGRQARILADLQASINNLFPELQRSVESVMRDVAGAEADMLSARLSAALAQLPEHIPVFRVPEEMLREAVTNYLPRNPSAGSLPVAERLKDLAPRTGQRVARAFQEAVARGDGSAKLASAIRKIVGKNSITAHEAATLARTQLQRVANDVARDFYARNSDVCPMVQQVATLDKRTCLQCAALAGRVYRNGEEPADPLHPQCRCFPVPVVGDWRALGIKPGQATPEIRRLFDGKPGEHLGYEPWLKAQDAAVQREVLGASRFDAWSKGKAELSDFATDSRILSVADWLKKAA